MKTIIRLLLWSCGLTAGQIAGAALTSSYSDRAVEIPGGDYDISFGVFWSCDDYPQNSAPGRIQLLDSAGNEAGRVSASVYRTTGSSVSPSTGTVSDVGYSIALFAPNGTPADGQLSAVWHLSGLAPGSYTVRLWDYTSWDNRLHATTVWTTTYFVSGSSPTPANRAPAISWTSAPSNATNGQTYTISAHGHDDDGNLTQVNVWKNGQPFTLAGGGNGTDGDSANSTSDPGPQAITFTAQAADGAGATSPVITHVITIDAPVNNPPSVTLLSPGAQTVTAGTALTISSHATDADGNLTGHNLDIQRPAGDWNYQGGFATGEPFQGGPVGSGGDSTRTASFAFSDPGTYQVRSAAYDGSGWYHSATVAITVVAPPPVQYSLVTSAGAGGTVSPGGTYNAGTVLNVAATPDGIHDFAGWSGDAAGAGNPVAVLLDRNKAVHANFSPKVFALTTSATTGGSVTPGGSYPYGTSITVSAAPDATHRFIGWAGGASGTAPSILLTLTGPLNVQAVFTDKTAQTLTFPAPADQPVAGPPLTLNATISSGLPVSYAVLSGPASLTGNRLVITGPGAVTVQASQAGDGFYLPAAPVTRTFNAYAAAVLRYRPNGRTLLQGRLANGAAPFVVQTP